MNNINKKYIHPLLPRLVSPIKPVPHLYIKIHQHPIYQHTKIILNTDFCLGQEDTVKFLLSKLNKLNTNYMQNCQQKACRLSSSAIYFPKYINLFHEYRSK